MCADHIEEKNVRMDKEKPRKPIAHVKSEDEEEHEHKLKL